MLKICVEVKNHFWNWQSHVTKCQNILHQQSIGVLEHQSSKFHSLSSRIFLALVAPEKNNRHELDFLLCSFARYTNVATISYYNDETSTTDEYKEGEPLSTSVSIPTPISVLLPLSQCPINCLVGFERPHGLFNLCHLSVHL